MLLTGSPASGHLPRPSRSHNVYTSVAMPMVNLAMIVSPFLIVASIDRPGTA
jgi:hypothetical protein